MSHDVKKTQAVLSWLPGYMWSFGTLVSTGGALPPTMHLDPKTGEVKYYVRPIFRDGASTGLFLKKKGVEDAIRRGEF